jgi:hypothetical protein
VPLEQAERRAALRLGISEASPISPMTNDAVTPQRRGRCLQGALEMLNPPMKGWGFYALQRRHALKAQQAAAPPPTLLARSKCRARSSGRSAQMILSDTPGRNSAGSPPGRRKVIR